MGSSPVTSTTKKRRVFALRFFVFADANPRPLPFYRAPGNRSEARFSGRGGAERARGRRPAGAARESSRPRRRGFKSRHLDHEKAKGFLPFAFLFLRTRTHDLFPFTGLPEIAAKRYFREEEERSAHAGAALPGRREKAADRDDEGSSPVTSTTKKRRVCPSLFCITNALAGGKGAMKQKSKNSYFLRRSAAETARARKAARIQRTRSFGI